MLATVLFTDIVGSTGECELIDGKVGGMAINIGSRVASRAQASEVLVSQTVRDLVVGSAL